MIPESDLAYLAGVIDVMGRIWTRPSSNGRRLPLLELNANRPELASERALSDGAALQIDALAMRVDSIGTVPLPVDPDLP